MNEAQRNEESEPQSGDLTELLGSPSTCITKFSDVPDLPKMVEEINKVDLHQRVEFAKAMGLDGEDLERVSKDSVFFIGCGMEGFEHEFPDFVKAAKYLKEGEIIVTDKSALDINFSM